MTLASTSSVPGDELHTLGAARLVDELNRAFLQGDVSGEPTMKAGVFVRAFDQLEDGERPWLPLHDSPVSDRFASSLINRKHPDIYSSGVGGIVISWAAVSINCAYYADGGSQKQTCSPPGRSPRCMPGCTRGFCDPKSWRNWGCAWRGEHLQNMMEQMDSTRANGGYNEVVLDSARWKEHLPNTVLAVFTLPESNPGFRERAIKAHRLFLSDTGRTAEQVPLLMYDKKRCKCYAKTTGCNCQGPFSVFQPQG